MTTPVLPQLFYSTHSVLSVYSYCDPINKLYFWREKSRKAYSLQGSERGKEGQYFVYISSSFLSLIKLGTFIAQYIVCLNLRNFYKTKCLPSPLLIQIVKRRLFATAGGVCSLQPTCCYSSCRVYTADRTKQSLSLFRVPKCQRERGLMRQ